MPESTAAPYRYALILGSLLCLPALLAIRAIPAHEMEDSDVRGSLDSGERFPRGIFLVMLVVGLLHLAALGAVRTFFNVYLDEGLGLSTTQIGILFSIIWLVSAPVPLLMPRLARRWGLRRTIISTSLGVAASAALMALVPHWTAAAVARFGVAGISSINFAAVGVFQMEVVRPRWRSLMSGLMNMTMGLSWAALSMGGGYIIATSGYRTLFLLGTTLTVVGILIFAWYFRVPRGEMGEPGAV